MKYMDMNRDDRALALIVSVLFFGLSAILAYLSHIHSGALAYFALTLTVFWTLFGVLGLIDFIRSLKPKYSKGSDEFYKPSRDQA